MKKIIFSFGLAMSLGLTSCSDFLDKEPSTELPSNGAITSVADL